MWWPPSWRNIHGAYMCAFFFSSIPKGQSSKIEAANCNGSLADIYIYTSLFYSTCSRYVRNRYHGGISSVCGRSALRSARARFGALFQRLRPHTRHPHQKWLRLCGEYKISYLTGICKKKKSVKKSIWRHFCISLFVYRFPNISSRPLNTFFSFWTYICSIICLSNTVTLKNCS